MIINKSKVKTEALLLFCRDLINSYNKSGDDLFIVEKSVQEFIDSRTTQLLKAINTTVEPIDYYIRNSRVTRINFIIKTYEFINKNISKQMEQNQSFNPFMLCFSLLSTWFAELQISQEDREFIYFSIYPYGEVFDTMILKVDNKEYKKLSINMLEVAERCVFKLHNYNFK